MVENAAVAFAGLSRRVLLHSPLKDHSQIIVRICLFRADVPEIFSLDSQQVVVDGKIMIRVIIFPERIKIGIPPFRVDPVEKPGDVEFPYPNISE